MPTVPDLADHFALRIDGLARLVAARDVLDVIAGGHWQASPAIIGAVVDLLVGAELRFRLAEAVDA